MVCHIWNSNNVKDGIWNSSGWRTLRFYFHCVESFYSSKKNKPSAGVIGT